MIFKSSTLTKHCVGARILKIGVFEENAKNLRKIVPNLSQNPIPEIDENSKKIQKKCHDDGRKAKNAQKSRKSAKNGPTWLQDPPNMTDLIWGGGLRVALSGLLNFHSRSILPFCLTTLGEDPRALRPLRGDRRHPVEDTRLT